jgi:hypothetical protein
MNEELIKYINDLKTNVKYPIVITLPKVSGINIDINNISDEFASLRYRYDKGFYVSTCGSWYSPEEAKEYADKLTFLSRVAEKLTELYKEK